MHGQDFAQLSLNMGQSGLDLSPNDVADAITSCRGPYTLDDESTNLYALNILHAAFPDQVTRAFETAMLDCLVMKGLCVTGKVLAKRAGAISASKLRSILPLPTFLKVIDTLLYHKLRPYIDERAAACAQDSGFLELATQGTQTLDVAHAATLAIERGLDSHSDMAVAQADIEKFYDNLRPALVAQEMQSIGVPGALVAAWLIFQTMPMVRFRIAKVVVDVGRKNTGAHTGAKASSIAGRLPILSLAAEFKPIQRFRWTFDAIGTSYATFVDNLLTIAPKASTATGSLDAAGAFLARRWGLVLSDDSKEYTICKSCAQPRIGHPWTSCTVLKTLGHRIQGDGSFRAEFAASIADVWKAFWSNYHAGLSSATAKAKARFISTTCLTKLCFRWAKWSFTAGTARAIDKVQRKLLAAAHAIRPNGRESAEEFINRRHLQTGRLAKSIGLWSVCWAQDIAKWHGHIVRQDAGRFWTGRILKHKGQSWIEAQRARFTTAWGSQRTKTRTKTRASSGKVFKRWEAGLDDAKVYLELWA